MKHLYGVADYSSHPPSKMFRVHELYCLVSEDCSNLMHHRILTHGRIYSHVTFKDCYFVPTGLLQLQHDERLFWSSRTYRRRCDFVVFVSSSYSLIYCVDSVRCDNLLTWNANHGSHESLLTLGSRKMNECPFCTMKNIQWIGSETCFRNSKCQRSHFVVTRRAKR